MDAWRIRGGRMLQGEIAVSGSKNACLPIMAACLLASGESCLHHVPRLDDVDTMRLLLERMGVKVRIQDASLRMDTSGVQHAEVASDLVQKMRASILVLGPLLARFGHARVALPGGCAIGARPIDQHLQGLQRLGARLHMEHGCVLAHAPEGLKGASITLDMPTVTGTENLMLAASLAQGTTVLINAAREPEVVDLAHALQNMGVPISGADTGRIVIEGQTHVHPYTHRTIPDRIETGTLLLAGALAGAPLTIRGGVLAHQTALVDALEEIGISLEADGDRIQVQRTRPIGSVALQTAPYPGFPTDMQAQTMTLLSLAQGTSTLDETIFENRLMHVAELNRLGARIHVRGHRAFVQGVPALSGSTVTATDLRASACLVLAALATSGETVIRSISHIDRGYERLADKLNAVGAQIERITEPEARLRQSMVPAPMLAHLMVLPDCS